MITCSSGTTSGCTPSTNATNYTVHVDAYVNNGGYIAGADVNIAQGAGLPSGGSSSAPYLWSF
ncbi:hypothetical protein [Streptomyces sp. NPDC002265]|uniref:hypothetical protein n=1 Tax=Streptomyces sp. NPDC002265 TaxID=3154415 RepID=UPI00331B4E59